MHLRPLNRKDVFAKKMSKIHPHTWTGLVIHHHLLNVFILQLFVSGNVYFNILNPFNAEAIFVKGTKTQETLKSF